MLNEFGRFLKKRLAPRSTEWPFSRDHEVLNSEAPVVVVGIGRNDAMDELSSQAPSGLCMLATIGSAKDAAALLRALAANLSVQSLIIVGDESAKLPLGTALTKLVRNDDAPAGPIGVVMNTIASLVDADELSQLRKRVAITSLIGCNDAAKIATEIERARAGAHRPETGIVTSKDADGVARIIVPRDIHYEARGDKTGHFRIRLEERSIVVEHVNGKNVSLRVLEGKTARDLCVAIIRNGWISKLDHAAYLGRELARAEICLRNEQPYRQDSVEPDADPIASRARD